MGTYMNSLACIPFSNMYVGFHIEALVNICACIRQYIYMHIVIPLFRSIVAPLTSSSFRLCAQFYE